MIPCGNLGELENGIRNSDLSSVAMVCIHVGVNDTDKKSGQEVFSAINNIVSMIQELSPNIKIVLSELTPRNDERDPAVQRLSLIHI